jgi:hypothetical protein
MYWPVLSSIFCKAHMDLGFGQARSGPVLTNRHKTCSQCTCARLLVHIEIGRGRWFLLCIKKAREFNPSWADGYDICGKLGTG